MSKNIDEMSAKQIKEYLAKNKVSLEEARDIFSREQNGEMRAEAMEAIGEYMAGLVKPKKNR